MRSGIGTRQRDRIGHAFEDAATLIGLRACGGGGVAHAYMALDPSWLRECVSDVERYWYLHMRAVNV